MTNPNFALTHTDYEYRLAPHNPIIIQVRAKLSINSYMGWSVYRVCRDEDDAKRLLAYLRQKYGEAVLV